MKKVIGVDMDDVLMDFGPALHNFHNKRYNTRITKDQVSSFNLPEIWGCSQDESIQRVFEFYDSEDHYNTPPMPDAPASIIKLKEQHSIVLITSRPSHFKLPTVRWLDRHFANMLDHICITNLYGGVGSKKTKAEACTEFNVDIFVDDHIAYAEDVAHSGRKALLFDQPWNQNTELHPNITRVHSWSEVLDKIES